jgi:hypothetical protein
MVKNKDCLPYLLQAFSSFKSERFREFLCIHPSSPAPIVCHLIGLIKENQSEVCLKILDSEDAAPQLIEKIAEVMYHSFEGKSVFKKAFRLMTEHRNTPDHILNQLCTAADTTKEMLEAIYKNPSASLETKALAEMLCLFEHNARIHEPLEPMNFVLA